jgi:hypothetical protein
MNLSPARRSLSAIRKTARPGDCRVTSAQPPNTQASARSSFVSVVAWVFIVISGFTTVIGALQNLMIRSMPFDQFNGVLQDSTAASQFPGPARFIFSHVQLLFLASFLLSLLTLISSVGLLRRRNWARLVFMGLLVLGIAYMIGGLFLQQSFMSSFDTSFRAAAPQDSLFRANAEQFASMITAMRIFLAVFSVGIAGLFGWIVVRLCSAKVRAEFIPRAV